MAGSKEALDYDWTHVNPVAPVTKTRIAHDSTFAQSRWWIEVEVSVQDKHWISSINTAEQE